MDFPDTPRKMRRFDRSTQEARRAVHTSIGRFSKWRSDIALFMGKARTHYSVSDRNVILDRCDQIERELEESRTELTILLADAPLRVSANSYILDVERAFDNMDRAVAELRTILHTDAEVAI